MTRTESLATVHRAIYRAITGEPLPAIDTAERNALRCATHHLADSGDVFAFAEVGIRAVRALIAASLADLAQRQRLDAAQQAEREAHLH